MAIGVLAIIDLSNLAGPSAGAYFAVVLGIVGAGMLIGTKWGRGRGLIVPGLIAAIALGLSVVAEADGYDPESGTTGWTPQTMNELSTRQSASFGDATLDLRSLDFAGLDKATRVELGAGNLTVLLPPNVDVVVDVELGAGNATAQVTAELNFDKQVTDTLRYFNRADTPLSSTTEEETLTGAGAEKATVH